ncbi:LysR substrate-binding domain-containing protein [Acidisphaera sp. L21]|uniref:LysR substrate-binding domain-containing protein n=1 Tax=Acidisphaera sp. L21 TaxID=1641851 RepID=UPI00131D5370|nr:LysR substrate-binding domain-containing protein [Acidisphaera sp. L21]
MNWRLPPLNALRAFEAAGRHCSVTLAAAELHVTPGAVSRQIKLLEATLGIELFARNNREVRLTAESALYLNALTDGFRRMNAATNRLRDSQRERPLRIMCSGNVATRWLFPRLRQFHTINPNRHVLLTTSLTTATAAFDSDAADCIIRLGMDPWPADMVAHRLFDSDLIPICSPDLLQTGPGLKTPADLKDHTLLYSELRPEGWIRWLALAGLPPFESFTSQCFESSALVGEAASEGLGVALGERHLIMDDLRKGRLVTPLPLSQRQPEGFYLIYRRQAQIGAQLQEFRDWILSHEAAIPRAALGLRNAQARAS